MGRPYESDLSRLPDTYKWAHQLPLSGLTSAIEEMIGHPIVAIGSGGSLSTAYAVGQLHEANQGGLARVATPLEIVKSALDLSDCGVLIVSAGGRNPDILAALAAANQLEPRKILVACANPGSPLSHAARSLSNCECVELPIPGGRDGYLATNSLLAFLVTFARAYSVVFSQDGPPVDLHEILGQPLECWAEELRAKTKDLWTRRYLLVLHGVQTKPAAVDLESKFAESALAAVQTADYRNFAHGRHLWLSRRGQETAVIALISPEDADIAERTLVLFPPGIPICREVLKSGGANAIIQSMLESIVLTGLAGQAHDVDPGRPNVPGFGRKLYHLKIPQARPSQRNQRPRALNRAIRRKWPAWAHELRRNAYTAAERFLDRLEAATIRAVVLDYDGTLITAKNRYQGVDPGMATRITGILREEMPLAIATGRGRSAGDALRAVIPKKYWSRVLVAYYNGGVIARLTEPKAPDDAARPGAEMSAIADALRSDAQLSNLVEVSARRFQVTLELRRLGIEEAAWDIVAEVVQRTAKTVLEVVRSSHSVDVLASGVSKVNILPELWNAFELEETTAILCIGDRGQWPGNDARLLSGPYSLSADQVSPHPGSCWNLAPAGVRGAAATEYYLDSLSCRSGQGRFLL